MRRERLKPGQIAGDLGVSFEEPPPDTPPGEVRVEVSYVDPAGPAARTGLVVGDVITSIDIDVTGACAPRAYMRTRAPVGTQLELGLARGETIAVTLAAPR